MKPKPVGIDLGTSYSSIARLNEMGQPVVLDNAEGQRMTPSAVYFGEDGVIVGDEAMRLGLDNPGLLLEHAKRYLGRPRCAWAIGGTLFTPVDVSAFILRKLREDAERQVGPLGPAVVTVPVHFNPQQRQLTIEAGKQAGLDVIDVVNEPVAAALAFILGDGLAFTTLMTDTKTILVFDLGGGTFDLSLVHYSDKEVRVLAAGGDMQLGGIDWNQLLIDDLATRFRGKHGADLRHNKKQLRAFNTRIEEAKRSLSNKNRGAVAVTVRNESHREVYQVTRDAFEDLTAELVGRTMELADDLVRSAGIRWVQLDHILPVGGATRMPMIQGCLESLCERFMPAGFKPNYKLSPDLAVAQGAALYAGLLCSRGEDAPSTGGKNLGHLVPRTASSRSLGLAVSNGKGSLTNRVLIPRNTPLPASVSIVVGTVKPNQPRISLRFVEGEEGVIPENAVLSRCVIDKLPEGLPAQSAFDVELTYESNGLLKIVAKHRQSGRVVAATIVRPQDAD